MKAKEFEQKFETGEDLSEMLDLANAKRPLRKKQTLEINLPIWLIEKLRKEASRLGISSDNLIEQYLIQHL